MSQEEISELRVELAALRIRVRLQEEKVERLEEKLKREVSLREGKGRGEEVTSERAPSPRSGVAVSEIGGQSSAGYSFVSEAGGGLSQVASVGSAVSTEDHRGRLQLARGCGLFLRRALEEDFRGSSGRDRLRLQSRLYVVAADYAGHRFNPVKLCYTFAEVRGLCKRGSCCGRSVFIGFGSRWEAEAALEAGGFSWPEGR